MLPVAETTIQITRKEQRDNGQSAPKGHELEINDEWHWNYLKRFYLHTEDVVTDNKRCTKNATPLSRFTDRFHLSLWLV